MVTRKVTIWVTYLATSSARARRPEGAWRGSCGRSGELAARSSDAPRSVRKGFINPATATIPQSVFSGDITLLALHTGWFFIQLVTRSRKPLCAQLSTYSVAYWVTDLVTHLVTHAAQRVQGACVAHIWRASGAHQMQLWCNSQPSASVRQTPRTFSARERQRRRAQAAVLSGTHI